MTQRASFAALDGAFASLGEKNYTRSRARVTRSQQWASAAIVEVAKAVAVLQSVPVDDRDEAA
jgi:hypothetical protein